MPCIRIPNGFITVGGLDRHIKIGDEVITFEDHSYMGPIPLGKNGNPKRLDDHHIFWTAVTYWYQHGKKMTKDGLCVWRKEQEPENVQ